MTHIACISLPLPGRPRGRGFAFTEVLFAVMVLGIGFIMIAAMFPVTIRQTQSSVEDTVAANIAKEAVAALQSCPNLSQLPSTGLSADSAVVADMRIAAPDVWASIAGNLVHSQNPKYAWVPLYRRALDAGQAQVFVIVTQVRNRSQYNAFLDVSTVPTIKAATLQPRLVMATLRYDDVAESSQLTFEDDSKLMPNYGRLVAGPGAFVVIAGTLEGSPLAGNIYQLGNRVNSPNDSGPPRFELQPGAEMLSSDENVNKIPAYIVGRGFSEATLNGNGSSDPTKVNEADIDGGVQDIGVYTAFVRIDKPPTTQPIVP